MARWDHSPFRFRSHFRRHFRRHYHFRQELPLDCSHHAAQRRYYATPNSQLLPPTLRRRVVDDVYAREREVRFCPPFAMRNSSSAGRTPNLQHERRYDGAE